jgi:hypothetical protein
MTRPHDSAWPRRALLALALLVAAHVALAVFAIARQPPDSPYNPVDTTALRQLGFAALAVMLALAVGAGRRPALAIATSLVAAACALLSPGAVLSAGALMLAAWLLGDLVLARAVDASDGTADLALPCGLAIVVALLAATGTLAIHDRLVYAAVLVAIVGARFDRAIELLARLGARLRATRAATGIERAWMALLGVVAFLHLVVVAKPEVGYDAMTMHLQFARLVAERHAWDPDVGRYAWSVMPLGADWLFAVGYVLGGEACARLVNFAAAALAGRLLFRLVARSAPGAWPALAVVTLCASAPLAFLTTGSLFSEALLCAFLLGTLVALRAWSETRAPGALSALAWCAAGALQTKAVAILWVVPLAAGVLVAWRADVLRAGGARHRTSMALALCAGAWPYANAWLRTGNPVFPFMNRVFRSPLFPADASFNNATFNAPLLPWTPWQIVVDSSRFLEAAPGSAGAPGFQWLLVLPLVVVALATRRYTRLQLGVIGLAALFFALVFLQQSYLRYLMPALLVGGVAAGWMLNGLAARRVVAATALALGSACVVANVRFMDTASWTNADICRHCATDPAARAAYVARYSPLRVVSDWLNANLPAARVGFLLLGSSPAGYVGYSRAWNWHDVQAYDALTAAYDPDAVLAEVRRWRLTHVVVPVNPAPLEVPMTTFGERYARPIAQLGAYRIAEVVAPPSAAGSGAAR